MARLIGDLGIARIAVLYQDDSFGRSGLAGVRRALERRGLELVGAGTYMRNTTAVKTALLGLRAGEPRGDHRHRCLSAERRVHPVGTQARDRGAHRQHLLRRQRRPRRQLDDAGNSVYVSQVMPFPEGDDLPLLSQYRQALVSSDASARPSYGSLEGYIAGRLTAAVLARAGNPPTREGFLSALGDTGTFDIGGFILKYGRRDNRGSHRVYLTVIRDGAVVPTDRLAR